MKENLTEHLLLTMQCGLMTSSQLMKMVTTGLIRAVITVTNCKLGVYLETQFSRRLGKVWMWPCLPMVKQVQASHTLCLDMAQIKVLYPWLLTRSSRGSAQTMIQLFHFKLQFTWLRSTWRSCKTCWLTKARGKILQDSKFVRKTSKFTLMV